LTAAPADGRPSTRRAAQPAVALIDHPHFPGCALSAQHAAGADRAIAPVCGGGRACGGDVERRSLAWAARRLSRMPLAGYN